MTEYERGLYGEFDQTLDEMLEEAKKHPFKVAMDFETRFRVWVEQVLHDRLANIDRYLSLDFTIRMITLTLRDGVRLVKRAEKELLEVADIPDHSEKHATDLKAAQNLYEERYELVMKILIAVFTAIRDKANTR